MTNTSTNNDELDKILDDAFKLIRPVLKVENGTGIMGSDSARLSLKYDFRRYAQKMVVEELKELEVMTHEGRGTILWEMDVLSDKINDRITTLEKELKDE